MADDTFPTDYDAVVLGTGMTECIIAAALSRIGQKVLHLDRNDYYSGDWGTFHFEALQTWISERSGDGQAKTLPSVDIDKQKALLEEGEEIIPLRVNTTTVRNVKETVHIPEDHPEVKCDEEKEEKCEASQTEDNDNNDSSQASDIEKIKDKKPDVHIEEENKEDGPSEPNDSETDKADPQGAPTESAGEKEDEKEKDNIKEQGSNVPARQKDRKTWCFSDMKQKWRQFNVDLQPKILYCSGPMVELLISSDIAKYCEFKSVTRILTQLDCTLQQVPCSRADVFSSRLLSMIEKRMLMKFLTFSVEYEKHPEEYQGFEDKTFEEFLKSRKVTANVSHYIKSAIAMVTPKTSTVEGLKSTKQFLRSLGRYGNTAFLWPLYGSGELPQCFCRMCAVFGGVYCLRRTGVSLIVDKEKKCKGVIDTEGVRLNAKYVIAESSYTTEEMINKTNIKSISRGIFVTSKSLKSSDTEHISLLTMPPDEGREDLIKVLELCPSSHACPRNTYLVHMTCEGVDGPERDLASATRSLFQEYSEETADTDEDKSPPKILWSLHFSQEDTNQVALNSHGIDGLHVVASPDTGLDFDMAIVQARAIFEKLCPGEEFLPRAPNPEDIIYDYDQQGPNQEGSGFEPKEEDKPETEEATKDSQTTDRTTGKESSTKEGQEAGEEVKEVKEEDKGNIDQEKKKKTEIDDSKQDESSEPKENESVKQ